MNHHKLIASFLLTLIIILSLSIIAYYTAPTPTQNIPCDSQITELPTKRNDLSSPYRQEFNNLCAGGYFYTGYYFPPKNGVLCLSGTAAPASEGVRCTLTIELYPANSPYPFNSFTIDPFSEKTEFDHVFRDLYNDNDVYYFKILSDNNVSGTITISHLNE